MCIFGTYTKIAIKAANSNETLDFLDFQKLHTLLKIKDILASTAQGKITFEVLIMYVCVDLQIMLIIQLISD